MSELSECEQIRRRHLRIGWWSLLLFLSLGMVLETLHGFKIGWYLNPSNETRRLVWTLAHAHGALFSLIHLAYAATLGVPRLITGSWCASASAFLSSATILLPGGFFLGGFYIRGGDPGMGIFLVPVGAFCLLLAVLCVARNLRFKPPSENA